MSKSKKKNQAKKVLSSFADLGNTGKSTLSRLATTVKADMPTVILGKKDPFAGTVKTDSIKGFGENKLSNLAKRLIPFRAVHGGVQNKPAAARLKHIAGKMGNAAVPKTRKSKGIIWLILFFAATCAGGYYAWESVDGLSEKVISSIDYKSWLNKTAGKVPTKETRVSKSSGHNIGSRVKTSYSGKKNNTIVNSSTVKTKKVSLKKSPQSAAKKSKKFSQKTASAKKEKQWQAKLAKLKKKSQADYRKASVHYRKNHK